MVWADAGYRGDNALLLRAAIACVSPCGGIVLACEALRSETVTRTFRRRFGEYGLFVVEILGEGGDGRAREREGTEARGERRERERIGGFCCLLYTSPSPRD